MCVSNSVPDIQIHTIPLLFIVGKPAINRNVYIAESFKLCSWHFDHGHSIHQHFAGTHCFEYRIIALYYIVVSSSRFCPSILNYPCICKRTVRKHRNNHTNKSQSLFIAVITNYRTDSIVSSRDQRSSRSICRSCILKMLLFWRPVFQVLFTRNDAVKAINDMFRTTNKEIIMDFTTLFAYFLIISHFCFQSPSVFYLYLFLFYWSVIRLNTKKHLVWYINIRLYIILLRKNSRLKIRTE